MAQFTKSLCKSVIDSDGKTPLTRHEKVQMAQLALKALDERAAVVPLKATASPYDLNGDKEYPGE